MTVGTASPVLSLNLRVSSTSRIVLVVAVVVVVVVLARVGVEVRVAGVAPAHFVHVEQEGAQVVLRLDHVDRVAWERGGGGRRQRELRSIASENCAELRRIARQKCAAAYPCRA